MLSRIALASTLPFTHFVQTFAVHRYKNVQVPVSNTAPNPFTLLFITGNLAQQRIYYCLSRKSPFYIS